MYEEINPSSEFLPVVVRPEDTNQNCCIALCMRCAQNHANYGYNVAQMLRDMSCKALFLLATIPLCSIYPFLPPFSTVNFPMRT